MAMPDAGEKIEARAEFVRARDQGFVYFQGYFFPASGDDEQARMPANRMNYLRMLQEVSRPDLELPELEKLIKAERRSANGCCGI